MNFTIRMIGAEVDYTSIFPAMASGLVLAEARLEAVLLRIFSNSSLGKEGL
ncbi:MAG: hypothetical protein IPL08_13835 [Saprospiraceae bacterium]|nr:hypothetical protein [Saprospiraceae bacterium]